jgi:putative hemolysin
MTNLFLSLLAVAFAAPSSLKVYEGKAYVDVQVQEYDHMQMTKDCFKGKTPACDAFSATKKKVTPREPQTDMIGHPAVRYCHDKGGVARILISADNKQYDYCKFKDGSMIDSWHLYYHHFPNK